LTRLPTFTSLFLSRTRVLYEGLSLSVHITGGANTEVYKIVYKKRDYLRKGNPVKLL